ncbi:hypothetical protein C883_3246 [Bacillus stratosphericus LAMA 585]|nr:hypothetical protein C883_3246 [Bacillus stratosphericus LAMA 585]
MTKHTLLFPYVASLSIVSANSSELFIFPSMARAMTWASGLILLRMRSPSLSLMIFMSCSLRFSGAFSSASSMISIFAYACNRFVYSAMPCFKYFSFNFPTVIIDIFTGHPHLKNKLFI